MSAYTSDGTIATKQIEQLTIDMTKEFAAGNYTICGGDFNKDILGDSTKYFGGSSEGYTWAQPFPTELLSNKLELVAPLDEDNPIPTCRNADRPRDEEGIFLVSLDGFIVSKNIEVVSSEVVDINFIYSDHNPVTMKFKLK